MANKKEIWKIVIQTLITILTYMANKKEIWKIVIQTLITILTSIGTALGVVSCTGV